MRRSTTFLFLVVIFGATSNGAPTQLAGLAIGLTPLSGGHAISQLWLFIIAPAIGPALASVLFGSGVLDAENV